MRVLRVARTQQMGAQHVCLLLLLPLVLNQQTKAVCSWRLSDLGH